MNVSIAMLRSHGPVDEDFRRKVDHAQRLLEQSMDMVHQFAGELRPSMLDHLGPVAALQNYVKSFVERTGIKIDIEGSVSIEQLNPQQGTVLYRVAQESLANCFQTREGDAGENPAATARAGGDDGNRRQRTRVFGVQAAERRRPPTP